MKTKDLVPGKKAMMYLFTGLSGDGKTIAAASFPKIYFVSLDNRMQPVGTFYPNRDDIDYDDFTNFEDFDKKIDEFERNCPFETLVIDSLTSLIELFVNYAIGWRGMNKDQAKKDKARHVGVVDLTHLEDFQGELRMISELLERLKRICIEQNVNIILTAHLIPIYVAKGEGKEPDIIWNLVTAGKKPAAIIPTVFDEIYFFTSVGGGNYKKYVIKPYGDSAHIGRSALMLPQEIDFTNASLYKLLQDHIKEKFGKKEEKGENNA